MTRGRKAAILTAALVAAGAIGGGAAVASGAFDDDAPEERRAEEAFTEEHLARVAVSRAEAEAAALAARPGTVLESNLEDEEGALVWEVEVSDGSRVWEVGVDPQTGEVLGSGGEEDGGAGEG